MNTGAETQTPSSKDGKQLPGGEHLINIATAEGYFHGCSATVLRCNPRDLGDALMRWAFEHPYRIIQATIVIDAKHFLIIHNKVLTQEEIEENDSIAREIRKARDERRVKARQEAEAAEKKAAEEREKKAKVDAAAAEEVRRLANAGKHCEEHHKHLIKAARK